MQDLAERGIHLEMASHCLLTGFDIDLELPYQRKYQQVNARSKVNEQNSGPPVQ